jgi:hypothetical protein
MNPVIWGNSHQSGDAFRSCDLRRFRKCKRTSSRLDHFLLSERSFPLFSSAPAPTPTFRPPRGGKLLHSFPGERIWGAFCIARPLTKAKTKGDVTSPTLVQVKSNSMTLGDLKCHLWKGILPNAHVGCAWTIEILARRLMATMSMAR